MRNVLRMRKQFVRERSSHIQRLQKTLEDANIKLDSVITDITGLSGRRMIEALIGGETDPQALAALAHRRIKATSAGRVPTGGVGRTEQAARKRAPHSAVASERLAAVIADSRVGSDCESQRNRGTRR